jgi:hypothetical protein
VRKAGNRVRISVQLVQVEDGCRCGPRRTTARSTTSSPSRTTSPDRWSRSCDDAARRGARLRRERAAQAEVAAAAQGRGGNPEAHRLYLEGRHFVDQFTREGVMRGVDRLEAATALDPTNALALATLARAYWFAGAYGFIPVTEGYGRRRPRSRGRSRSSPTCPKPLLVRAMLAASHEFDFRTAGAALERAYELAPGTRWCSTPTASS